MLLLCRPVCVHFIYYTILFSMCACIVLLITYHLVTCISFYVCYQCQIELIQKYCAFVWSALCASLK